MSRQLIIEIISVIFVLSLCSSCTKQEMVKGEESIPVAEKQAEQPPPVLKPVPLAVSLPPPLTSEPPAPSYSTVPVPVEQASPYMATNEFSSQSHGHVSRNPSNNTANNAIAVDYSLIIEEQIKSLKQGQILFNPAKQMKVGVTEIVEARIAKEINEHIAKGLQGRGVPQVEQIKVGTFMKVHLGGDEFEIKLRSNSEEQLIANEGFTTWEWDVTPHKGGPHTLLLTVTVRLKLPNGKEETQDYPVFRRPIDVVVDPVFSIKDFIVKYWQWVIGTLIIPFIGWIAMKKKDSKS